MLLINEGNALLKRVFGNFGINVFSVLSYEAVMDTGSDASLRI